MKKQINAAHIEAIKYNEAFMRCYNKAGWLPQSAWSELDQYDQFAAVYMAHTEALEINLKFIVLEPSKTIVIKVQKRGFTPNFVADIKTFPSAPYYKLTNNLEFAKKAKSLAEAEYVAQHYRDNGYFVEFIEIKRATFSDI